MTMALLDHTKINQQRHLLSWVGDVGDTLLLESLKGKESLSSLFHYELTSRTRATESELSRWYGESVSCSIGGTTKSSPQRFLHGIVTKISYKQHSLKEAECTLTLEPSLALLKMGRMMRVWQNINTPDIVNSLLKEYGINQVQFQLYSSYPKREYCVQYRESTFDFIERLLQEENIYYFFRHSVKGHTLVLADHPECHYPIIGDTLFWRADDTKLTESDVNSWVSSSSLLPERFTLTGFNISQATEIEVEQRIDGANKNISTVHFADITPDGERSLISEQTRKIIASYKANTHTLTATTNAHWLCSGEKFTLMDHPSGNKSYCIRTLTFDATNSFDGNSSIYNCYIQVNDNEHRWCTPQEKKAPEIPGVLTAIVVGPDSEDIYTDDIGRIKIKFLWNNKNNGENTSSCWVRVSQPLTGNRFGMQFIPRIGSEVIVSFIQGNPNFPLVIGSVFNGKNRPPFVLPDEKNESGFVTRSSANSSVDEGHRMSFNDKKGEELLTIIAQKNLSLMVKNDMKSTILANRSTQLDKGSDQLILKDGNINTTIEKGNWCQSVTGDITTELKNGSYILKVSGGNGNIKVDKALNLESTQSIELKVGNNKISLSPSGISINGIMLNIEGTGVTELKGAMTTISSNGITKISGGIVNLD